MPSKCTKIVPAAVAVLIFCQLTVNNVFASISDMEAQSAVVQPSTTADQGDQFFERGLYKEAIAQWRDEYKNYRAEQNLAGQVVMLYKIATAQRMMGLHDRSIRGLEVAIKLATLINDTNLSLMIRANLGGAYLYTGQFNLAKPLLVEALYSAEKVKNERLSALLYNDLGNYYAFTGQPDKAYEAFYNSGNLAIKLVDSYLVVQALTNAVSLSSDEHLPERALADLDQAISFIERLEASYEKAYGVEKVAAAAYRLLEQHQPEDVTPFYRVVGQLNKEADYAAQLGNHWLAAKLLLVEAQFYEYARYYDDALTLAKKAIFHSQLISDDNLTYRLQWQVARINKQLQHDDEAATFYRRAIETVQPIRHLLYEVLGNISNYEAGQGNMYMEFADLLLRHAHTSDQRKVKTELLFEARNVLERQKSEELQDYFKNQCVIEAHTKTISIDDAIDDHTAVIYPVLLPDRTELLVSYRNDIRQYVIDKNEKFVTDQVRNLRVKLEKKRTRDYLPYANELYRILISPLEQDLTDKEINTLVFVPDQSLRTIPIAVLHNGDQFLIDKFAVATIPGLSLTDPHPLKRGDMKVLLSGLSEPVQGYPPLDYVQGELEQIKHLYGAKLLMNKSFDRSNISSELQNTNYSVAHFASHAEFSGDVRDSFILTFDDRLSVSQLGQYVSIGQYKNKPIELLTLSACNTAAGDDRAALGLAGVAVQSGARSALASLWAINDKASSMLVTEFYRQLQDEQVTKAEALQRAQQKLLQNVRYRHPGYWSPFLLIGNWL
ncbi:CHAT domain-containing protein [Kaarinaea lacus]